MAGTLNFTNDCEGVGACEIGATFDKTLTWKIDGVPVNLTGATAKMHVRQRPATALVLELSTENTRIELGGEAGTIRLVLPASVTETLAAGAYVYDLLVNAGTSVERLIEGKFQVVASVTHA